MEVSKKLENLKSILTQLDSVAVAYSGGVDSNFLLKVAKDTLGDNVVEVTIHALMHSSIEIEEAKEFANNFGVKHIVVEIQDFNVEKFLENGPKRCYYCKKAVFTKVKEIAKKNNIEYVLDGTNLDDLEDYRPGLKALEELNIVSPLKECNLTKNEIRVLSKEMNLSTHNKPAFACLATRIPYRTRINNDILRMIEKGERYLLELGFSQFRARHHNDIARIEVEKSEMNKFFSNDILEKTDNKFKEIGFKYTTLDMSGYTTGNMNKVLYK